MDWTFDYLEKDGIVYLKLLNPLKIEDLETLLHQVKFIARENNSHRILVDHRDVEVGMSVLDLDRVPEVVKEFGADFQDRTAILLDSSSQEIDKFEFVRNVLTLQSFKIKICSDMDEAVAWLKSDLLKSEI